MLGSAAHAQREEASAARIAAMVAASRPQLSVAAPLTELAGAAAVAAIRPIRDEPRPAFLDVRDVSEQVSLHDSQIQRCYLDEAGLPKRNRRLDLTLTIARDGHVLSIQAAAPGLTRTTSRKVASCVRELLGNVQFPARRKDTTAVVPYLFQRTEAPDAGPLLSCWSAKGCR